MRTRELSLSTETLRNLQNWELKLVAGGQLAGGVVHGPWVPATVGGESHCECTQPDDLVEMQLGIVLGGMMVQLLPP